MFLHSIGSFFLLLWVKDLLPFGFPRLLFQTFFSNYSGHHFPSRARLAIVFPLFTLLLLLLF